jgi:hypothetical protein
MHVDKELFIIQMEINILDNGITINVMEEENI